MKVFKNQIDDPKRWGKLTTEAHLANAGMTSIQTSKMIERLVDLDIGANNFVSFVESLPEYVLDEENRLLPFGWGCRIFQKQLKMQITDQ